MGSEDFLIDLALQGGPIGIVVAVAVLGIGYFLRGKVATIFSDKSKIVATGELKEIGQRLDQIDSRVQEVERDVQNRPTRDEFHQLQLQLTKMGGRIELSNSSITVIRSAVTRIEDFMLNYSDRKGKS